MWRLGVGVAWQARAIGDHRLRTKSPGDICVVGTRGRKRLEAWLYPPWVLCCVTLDQGCPPCSLPPWTMLRSLNFSVLLASTTSAVTSRSHSLATVRSTSLDSFLFFFRWFCIFLYGSFVCLILRFKAQLKIQCTYRYLLAGPGTSTLLYMCHERDRRHGLDVFLDCSWVLWPHTLTPGECQVGVPVRGADSFWEEMRRAFCHLLRTLRVL